ncbi:DUF1800 domain-containing protein [Sphingomonas antarctica]|uniref:DUF1800 domain-containing protein n=1 Tax=Sphingomonas antarctica TaxID=2040274 RepID=UPI0039EBB767
MLDTEPTVVPYADAPEVETPSRMPGEILVSTLALAACGGGGSTPSGGSTGSSPPPPPAPPPSPPPPTISDTQASRFLAQSAMGSSRADIAEVVSMGYAGWLDAQFAKPRGQTLWDYLVAQGYNNATYINSEAGFDPSMWRALLAEPDQLRQRVATALLEIMVVGISGLNVSWRQFALAAYVDVLFDNAFGNFRTLLDKITTNAGMATFLTFLGNKKANAATGAEPDENYARELMQLFTLGLRQLNADGTEKTPAQETYVPADVSGLARVFTGLTLDSADNSTPDRLRRPLIFNAGQHETGVSTFLGATVPAGTDGAGAVKIALDTIFAHPNVGPFVSRQLIQRLVTSNPSAAYVGRVAAVFANNGSGTRGDLKATVRALLLDDEARTVPTGANAGKLREPVMRLTGWARAFGATSASNAWPIGDTSSQNNRLGESMGRSPSVFNWWRPGYVPPATTLSAAGLVAPEFQVTNEVSTIAYINFMQTLIQNGMGDFKADYTAITAKAADSAALVDEVNIIVAAGQLSAATIATIRSAVDSIAAANTANRVYTAILLTMASPDYLTLR